MSAFIAIYRRSPFPFNALVLPYSMLRLFTSLFIPPFFFFLLTLLPTLRLFPDHPFKYVKEIFSDSRAVPCAQPKNTPIREYFSLDMCRRGIFTLDKLPEMPTTVFNIAQRV